MNELLFIAALLAVCSCACASDSTEVEHRVDSILKKMTLEEKIDYIGGNSYLSMMPITRLGIPEIKMSDGPMGCHNYGNTTCYPAGVALAATWNPELAMRMGRSMGRDCRARGINILLAPGVNIYRSPLCGRNFEYMGEDPYLASVMVVPLIQGLQSQEVLATAKHLACNNQELLRHSISSEVDERTLHEIYLPAFKAAVTKGKVACVMSAYNRVNGSHCSQSSYLLTDILKNSWGFKGFVMSDWVSTYDAVAAANAGLDLEMPSGALMNRKNLIPAIKDGRVKESVIDDKIRRMLTTFIAAGFLDRPQECKDIPLDDPTSAKIALDGARESVVLLKNNKAVLPLDRSRVKSIAVIGPNAHPAVYCGGGSAFTGVFHSVSVLDGVKELVGGVEVKYNSGKPTLETRLSIPATMQIFNNKTLSGEPVHTSKVDAIDFNWTGKSPANGVGATDFSVRWTGKLRTKTSGKHLISAGADDGIRVSLDGKKIVDDWSDHAFNTTETIVEIEAGRDYDLSVEYYQGSGDASVSFGWAVAEDSGAVDAARQCDAAIVCVGFNQSTEREMIDRPFELPDEQLELIKKVAAVNPKTIVILNSGGGVAWDGWLDKVPAVMQAWYSGQEVGKAVAEIVFGDVNPSGKLPQTFEKKAEDNPTYPYFHVNNNGKTPYTEGIFVGYRGFDKNNTQPQFCFGYGLSYTTFKFGNLKITPEGKGDSRTFVVSCDVTNTGSRYGAEVAQLYVSDVESSVPRPIRELKGFQKVFLKPGETKTVKFMLDRTDLSFYSVDKHSWIVETGDFSVSVGSSSRDLPLAAKFRW